MYHLGFIRTSREDAAHRPRQGGLCDIAFARGKDIFASVGADGSVRLFDLRTLEHSTIIYETFTATAVEISLEQAGPKLLGYGAGGRSRTVVLDVRVPSMPVAELGAHQASVNSVAWAPHSSCHLHLFG